MIAKGTPYWRITEQTAENMYIMSHTENGETKHSPLFVISFRLMAPRKLLEAQLFNKQYHSYGDIDNISDRLRFCRHRLGLMQKEVAKMVGISRSTYINLETGNYNGFDRTVADKLSKLFNIPMYDLLDDYNRFLSCGQGKLIREYRDSLNLGKRPFARLVGADANMIRLWESERKQVSLKSWEKYFKNRIKV